MKVILENLLTVEDVFLIVIAEVESLLNSCRLHRRASVNIGPRVFVQRDMSLRRRWRHSQFLADQSWRRWREEYVLELVEYSK